MAHTVYSSIKHPKPTQLLTCNYHRSRGFMVHLSPN